MVIYSVFIRFWPTLIINDNAITPGQKVPFAWIELGKVR
jgi:hypothetical protein